MYGKAMKSLLVPDGVFFADSEHLCIRVWEEFRGPLGLDLLTLIWHWWHSSASKGLSDSSCSAHMVTNCSIVFDRLCTRRSSVLHIHCLNLL